MKLAINYPPQAEALAAQGAIDFNLFKCPPSWDFVVPQYAPGLHTRAGAARPIYLHFPLHAGNNSLRTTDWGQIEEALAQTEPPFVNVHLQAAVKDFPQVAAMTTAPEDRNRIAEVLIRDVLLVTDRFGPERVIVENVPYRGPEGGRLAPCVDPDVIRRVVEETGRELLLDLAHARLTCLALGLDARKYVARLPVARLRELHVTGAQSDGQRLRDSMPMGEEDWDLVAWATRRIRDGHWARPWALALEYGGVGPNLAWRSEASVIADHLPRLKGLMAVASSPGSGRGF